MTREAVLSIDHPSKTPTGWSWRQIGEFAVETRERAGDSHDLPVLSVTKHQGIVRADEYFSRSVHGRDTSGYKVVRPGDLAYATIHLDEGSIGVMDGDASGIISPMYTALRVDRRVDPQYLFLVLKHPASIALYRRLAEGTVNRRASISFESLSSVKCLLPPIAEQRKIAAILSSVDEAIDATQSVIEQLGVVKKAMMAELLTRGLPGRHTKFKQTEIGEVPESWEVVRLEALAASGGMVGGPFGSDLTTKDYVAGDGVPVIRGGNVGMGVFHETDYVFVSNEKAATLAKNCARRGDIVMTQRGASLGEVARIPGDSMFDLYVISQTMMRMTPRDESISASYLMCYLCSEAAQSWLRANQIATGQPHLNLGIFRTTLVVVPPADEQEAIARTAENIDAVVRQNSEYRDGLISLKSALMSVLLTGELRVKPDEDAP